MSDEISPEVRQAVRDEVVSEIASAIGRAMQAGADPRVVEGLRWALDVAHSHRPKRRKSPSYKQTRNRAISLTALYERDGGICYLCKERIPPDIATRDHVVPVSQGGKNRAWNIRLACEPCNRAKGDRIEEAE